MPLSRMLTFVILFIFFLILFVFYQQDNFQSVKSSPATVRFVKRYRKPRQFIIRSKKPSEKKRRFLPPMSESVIPQYPSLFSPARAQTVTPGLVRHCAYQHGPNKFLLFRPVPYIKPHYYAIY